MYEKWLAYVQQLLNPSSRLQNALIISIPRIYWSSFLNRLDIFCKLHLLLLYCMIFCNYDLSRVILDVWMCKQNRCYSAIPDLAPGFYGSLCCNVVFLFFCFFCVVYIFVLFCRLQKCSQYFVQRTGSYKDQNRPNLRCR